MNLRSSIWLKNANVQAERGIEPTYPALQNTDNVHYDVAVVGGGVVGCTAAYLLKSQGLSVALLEGRTVGTGTTGFSTSKVSAQQGLVYNMIASQHDSTAARAYYDMNLDGIAVMEELVHNLQLNCEWSRRSHTSFTCESSNEKMVRQEYDLCKSLDIRCSLLNGDQLAEELPASINARLAISFPDQAQFNAYKYCTELAKHIHGQDCSVFENSRVFHVDQGRPHVLHINENNAKVTANHVILATHMPIMDRSMHFAMLEPSRSHCVAVKVNKTSMRNMFINCEMPMRSLRTTGENDEIVVLAGDGVKQGEGGDTNQLYNDLEAWLRRHYDVREVVAKWSAMDYYSGDHIPFVGRLDRIRLFANFHTV